MRTTTTRHDALRPLQALLRAACFATLVFCSLIPLRAADSAGAVSGAVSNQATGNLLQGAKVEIPALGLSTLVDETGNKVMIDGFYDDIEPLSEAELSALKNDAQGRDLVSAARNLGVERFIADDPFTHLKLARYGTSMNIDGTSNPVCCRIS